MTPDDQKFHDFVDRVNTPSSTDVAQTRATIQNTLAQVTPAPQRQRIRPWQIGVLTAVAALFLLTLGGIFNPAMNDVFAKAPLVGQFFARFSDSDLFGVTVQNHAGTQKVNGQATVNGITLKLESAYVEGQTVGIEGIATGLHNEKDDNFNIKLGKAAPKSFEEKTFEVRPLGKGKYYFALSGQLNTADSQKQVHLPITITRFLGQKGPWVFNFKLTPSRATTTALTSNVRLPKQTKWAFTKYTMYSGGTGLLTINQSTADGDAEIGISSVKTAENGPDLLLNASALYFNGTKYGQKNTTIGYRIKQLPKNTKQLFIKGSVDGQDYHVTVPLE
ncbi:DUF4179 domain-containing protein [Schleiferilactobacillus perolens]|jgi:hypothetical protein|uniref:DUF4179 domain-containing protein n=1 Tax=Schleiferilactobacillus perolens TaxID=100468 RepID=UPI002357A91A|nr:DUF4179 domain-containing protein [Schleiferilactobacillus perolens]MCI2171010.1 DUF4179 domain-containing protein [Schleiferilactobacillus perolens]